MKNLILLLTFLFSITTHAQSTPDHLVIWGSIPPAIAKPGDSLHFLAIAPGNNLEYRFYSIQDGGAQQLIQDWSSVHSFNTILPLNFSSINYYAQVRAIGDTRVVEAWQSYIFVQDLVFQASELFPGEILKINHKYFETGEHYNVTFATASGYSRVIDGVVNTNGRLDVVVPEYIDPATGQNAEGMVTVSVEGVKTPKRKLFKIKHGASLPIADFSINLSNGGVVPFQASFDASLSYLPGHENESDRGITNCTWQLTRGNTGDKKITVPGCVYTPFMTEAGNYTISLTVTDINSGTATITKSFQAMENGGIVLPIAEFTLNTDSGPAPLDVIPDASGSYVPGHENDSDRGIAFCQFAISGGGKGEKIINCVGGEHFYLVEPGTYSITLTVYSHNFQSSTKVKTVTVGPSPYPGLIKGVTFKKNIAEVGNVPITITFTSDNSSFSTTSDPFGNFTFYLPLLGDYILTAALNDSQCKVSGTLDIDHSSQEIPVGLKQVGIGKVSGTIQLLGSNLPADATKIILKFFNSTDEYFTVADVNGNFSFDELPLNGNFYIVVNHPSSGSRSTFLGFIDDSTSEQNDIQLSIGSTGSFLSFMNGAFAFADFENWVGFGDNVLIPQLTAFTNPPPHTGDKILSHPPQVVQRQLGLASLKDREKNKLSPRTFLKSNTSLHSLLTIQKSLPCENNNLSALTANVGADAAGGQLFQDITIDADADTLIGRIRLLTNETKSAATIGYNDTFLLTLSNSLHPTILFMGDVKTTMWRDGVHGYKYASDEIDIAIDVKDLAGSKATFAAMVMDRGDLYGDSAMIISNFQFLKASDHNLVETGSFSGYSNLAKNVGAVSWFKVKNTKKISTFAISQNFHVLKNNEEIEFPIVKFGSEPMFNYFNLSTLNSTDIFNYTLDSTWVDTMPPPACLGGR